MMKTLNTSIIRAVLVLSLSTTACSMKDRDDGHSISVQLPNSANASTMNVIRTHNYSSMMTSYSTPTNISSFQCFALNITGPGIAPEPRARCTDPSNAMGLFAGFVPVEQGSIEVFVPAGPARKIELIAVQSTVIGCPPLDTLLNAQTGFDDIGKPYVLATQVVDIFGDTAISMNAVFDVNKKALESCGDHHGGSLNLQVVSNEPIIQGNNSCMPFGIYGDDNPSNLTNVAVKPIVTAQSLASSTYFYNDPSCTTPATHQTFSGKNFVNFFVKTSMNTGTFTAQVDTTATGWTTTPVTYGVASERLGMSQNNNVITTGACSGFQIQNYTAPMASPTPMSSGTLGNLEIQVENRQNTNTTPANTLQLFSDPTCTTQITATSTVGRSDFYALTGIGSSQTWVYFKDTVTEDLFIGVKKTSSSAQPTGTNLRFVPFSVIPPGGPLTSLPAGGSSISLNFNSPSFATNITGMKIGGVTCGSFSNVSTYVMCSSAPPFPANTQQQISLIYSGVEYPSGYIVQYGSAPVFSIPGDPYAGACTGGGTGCSPSSPAYYTLSGSSLLAIPTLVGDTTGMTCGAAGLPAGVSMVPGNCQLTGTPTAPTSSWHPVTITISKPPFANTTANINLFW